MRRIRIFLLGWLWCCFVFPVAAQTGDQSVPLPLFDQSPVIDGRLDEGAWQVAAVLRGFYQTQPGDNIQPSHPTEVFLGRDEKFLYIGIRATDEAGKVRATVAKRDDVLNDDHIRILLDTFNDQRRAYLLIFNPLGVQQDGIFTEGAEPDYSFDLVMESRGIVTEQGYTIEIAIPFRSLRYEAGANKQWGLHIFRRIKHLNDEEDSWKPLKRGQASLLAQAGHINGLENISTERTLELIPSLTVSETGKRVRSMPPGAAIDHGRLINQPATLDPGLTLKFGLTPNITLDLAVNPDFAQVESDQLIVTANQRFPIFFEERRPFFLEGVDIFQTPLRAVHTRTIIDPDIAVKLSGKRGRSSFGLLMASDNAPGNYSEEERNDPALAPSIARFIDRNAFVGVLRLKRDVGSRSSIGLLATSYDFVERHNQTLGVDGRFNFSPQTILTFQLLGTTARRNFYDAQRDENVYRTGHGLGYFTRLQRTGRHFGLTLTGEGRSKDYRADVGFTLQTNVNSWNVLTRYDSEPRPNATLISWSVLHTALIQFDWQGRMKYSYLYPRVLLKFKRQTFLNLHTYRDYLRLFEEEFGAQRTLTRKGAFYGAPERRTVYHGLLIEAGVTPSKKYSATVSLDRHWHNFDYDFGAGPRFPRVSPAALINSQAALDPGLGNALDLTASFNWQPSDAMRVSFNYTRSRLRRLDTKRLAYDQNLPSLRLTHHFTRFTFARARIDYDSLRSRVLTQVLFGWTPNPGTSFYAGYNDDLNYKGYSPFTGQYESGLHRNNRTFFVKMSYLIRRHL